MKSKKQNARRAKTVIVRKRFKLENVDSNINTSRYNASAIGQYFQFLIDKEVNQSLIEEPFMPIDESYQLVSDFLLKSKIEKYSAADIGTITYVLNLVKTALHRYVLNNGQFQINDDLKENIKSHACENELKRNTQRIFEKWGDNKIQVHSITICYQNAIIENIDSTSKIRQETISPSIVLECLKNYLFSDKNDNQAKGELGFAKRFKLSKKASDWNFIKHNLIVYFIRSMNNYLTETFKLKNKSSGYYFIGLLLNELGMLEDFKSKSYSSLRDNYVRRVKHYIKNQ